MDESRSQSVSDESDQLDHLRKLLVGPTTDSIQNLRNELEEKKIDVEEVAEALPGAINQTSKKKLARALGPTLSDAFQDSINRDPQRLVDAISPIMGPAIRRSISQQIQAMIQSLNKALDHSLSPRGIRWRIEAWRTGKPFAEVVLLHTLVYRIEQLFLIDRHTGLLMQSVASESEKDDANLVSSMLTALQDFTRDSFEHSSDDESGSDLQILRTNDFQVLIEHGPKAILAAAVRGEPPRTLRQRMQEVLEQIHVQHEPLLSKFRGDSGSLDIVRLDLEELLESEYVDQKPGPTQPKKTPGWVKHANWAVPALLLLGSLTWLLYSQRMHRRNYIADILDLPPSAKIEIADEVLKVSGSARHEWLVHAKNRMDRLPEFQHLDVSKLEIMDQDWVDFLAALRAAPGIIVTDVEREGSSYSLNGWRDPLAPNPATLMTEHGVNPNDVVQSWEPFRSMDSRLVIRRLRNHLEIPQTIKLELNPQSGKLHLSGTASLDWLRRLQRTIDVMESHASIDASQIKVHPPNES